MEHKLLKGDSLHYTYQKQYCCCAKTIKEMASFRITAPFFTERLGWGWSWENLSTWQSLFRFCSWQLKTDRLHKDSLSVFRCYRSPQQWSCCSMSSTASLSSSSVSIRQLSSSISFLIRMGRFSKYSWSFGLSLFGIVVSPRIEYRKKEWELYSEEILTKIKIKFLN